MKTLGDNLVYEIDRCIDLISEYSKISTGQFGSDEIKTAVMYAVKAAIAQDLPLMMVTYRRLQSCS